MGHLSNSLTGIVQLFYPRVCIACEDNTHGDGLPLCTKCLSELPLTGFETMPENPFMDRLKGRVDLEWATSLFYFTKHSANQVLIHRAKYSASGEIAYLLGRWKGQLIKNAKTTLPDLILPVPLHRAKLRSRGFNQSEWFGRGIAEELGCDLKNDVLMRKYSSVSQTKKGKVERIKNVHSSFAIYSASNIQGKHVLIVDDVLTTGATLEACANQLVHIPNIKISAATIAIAMN